MYYWIFSNKEPVLYVVYVYIMTINVSELNWKKIYATTRSKIGCMNTETKKNK